MGDARDALGYARRSVLDAKQGKSVGEQEEIFYRDCKDLGWQPTAIYVDDGMSASRYARGERRDWASLLDDLREGRGSAVWLWDPSRGGRELEGWSGFLNLCRTLGVLIYVSTHGRIYDLENARDWKALASDGVDSAYDSEKKSQDVRRGIGGAARAGKPHGAVAYGYRRLYGSRRELVAQELDPATAPIVERIFSRLAKGDPSLMIVRDLNAEGIVSPKGGEWSLRVLTALAANERYIGVRTHNGMSYDAMWPALVDESTFYAAQEVLKQRRDRHGRIPRPSRVKYLLTYLAECAVCEKSLHVMNVRDIPYYICEAPARHAASNVATFDEYVVRLTVARLARPDIASLLTSPGDSETVTAQQEVATIQSQLSDASLAYTKRKISIDRLSEIEFELQPKLEAARRRAEVVPVPPTVRSLIANADGNIAVIRQRWDDDLSISARRDVLRALYEHLRLRPAGRRGGPRGVFNPDRLDHEWRSPRA